MSDKYILNDRGEPELCGDLITWARWFEAASENGARKVARDRVGNCEVSTVFLGLDHNFEDGGLPVLWETMVFGGELNGEADRCSGNRIDAERMHKKMVDYVRRAR